MPCKGAMAAHTSIDTDVIRSYLAAKLQFSHGRQADVGSERINRALQLHGMMEREDGQFGMAGDGDFFRRKIDLVAQLSDSVVHAIVQQFADPCHSLGGASVDVEAKAVEWLRAKQAGPSSQVSEHTCNMTTFRQTNGMTPDLSPEQVEGHPMYIHTITFRGKYHELPAGKACSCQLGQLWRI